MKMGTSETKYFTVANIRLISMYFMNQIKWQLKFQGILKGDKCLTEPFGKYEILLYWLGPLSACKY